MAGASYTVTTARRSVPTSAQVRQDSVEVMTAFRDIAVKHVKTVEWRISRFKKPTGKSTNSWAGFVDKARLFLTINNTAENRYGTRYAPYVHLAGRPRNEKLVVEVADYLNSEVYPPMLRAVNYAFLKRRETAPMVRKTVRIGG